MDYLISCKISDDFFGELVNGRGSSNISSLGLKIKLNTLLFKN